MQFVGLLIPWLVLAVLWRPNDGVTHPRYYIAPAIAGAGALAAVFLTDPGPTPDFWIGASAGLASIAAGAFVLIIQGLMPLEWWIKNGESSPAEPARDQAS